MVIKRIFYRIRFWLLMYGFAWVLRLAGIISRDFHASMIRSDYSFIMGSKDDETVRFFQLIGGKLRSGPGRMSTDFALMWRDNQSAGRVMINMILGKRKALYHAVMNGELMLEGEGKYVSLFMETMNQLNRVFRPEKRNIRAKRNEP